MGQPTATPTVGQPASGIFPPTGPASPTATPRVVAPDPAYASTGPGLCHAASCTFHQPGAVCQLSALRTLRDTTSLSTAIRNAASTHLFSNHFPTHRTTVRWGVHCHYTNKIMAPAMIRGTLRAPEALTALTLNAERIPIMVQPAYPTFCYYYVTSTDFFVSFVFGHPRVLRARCFCGFCFSLDA